MTVEDTVAGPTRVMLVALPLMSWGLERLLEGDHGRWSVVGVVESAAEGVLRMEQIEPDVIVFDLDGEEGTESLAHLQAQTTAKILALTSSRDPALQDSAVLVGARGVVGKYEAPVVLLRALEKIHNGEMWIERSATSRIFLELSRHQDGRWRSSRRASVSVLTPKEKADGRGPGLGCRGTGQGDRAAPQHQRAHAAQPPDLDLSQALGLEPGRVARLREPARA